MTNPNPWFHNDKGVQPCADDVLVDVEWRDGSLSCGIRADAVRWAPEPNASSPETAFYRLHVAEASVKENVVSFKTREYIAKQFEAVIEGTVWKFSGTLCGHIDMATPSGTFVLSPDEIPHLIAALQAAREDVLRNADPVNDRRLRSTVAEAKEVEGAETKAPCAPASKSEYRRLKAMGRLSDPAPVGSLDGVTPRDPTERASYEMMEHMAWLHIYGQADNHMPARIIGTPVGLAKLANALAEAVFNGKSEMKDAFAKDGEGYSVEIERTNSTGFDYTALPYIDAMLAARGK